MSRTLIVGGAAGQILVLQLLDMEAEKETIVSVSFIMFLKFISFGNSFVTVHFTSKLISLIVLKQL